MKAFFKSIAVLVGLLVLVNSCNTTKVKDEPMELTEEQLLEKARGIHERVITLDTHDDINTRNFVAAPFAGQK